MNMKWVGRTVRKTQRFCRRNEEVLAGISIMVFLIVFVFGGSIIGALLS